MKSYFIDTNYFLRLFIKDNRSQHLTVYRLFQKAIKNEVKLTTSIIVFFELYWVLKSFYKKDKKKCVFFLEKILQMSFLEIENPEILLAAITLYKNFNLDLEDCYNIVYYKIKNIDKFASFDKKVLKLIK